MNYSGSIFTLFLILGGVLTIGIWINVHVYAQQLTGNSSISTISPEVKAKMCDPSNPGLKVVNTTESTICGIPKTVKPSSPATPTTTTSLSRTTPKPTSISSISDPSKQRQQQIASTSKNNNINGAVPPSYVSPVSNPINKSLSPIPIMAPQANQQQLEEQQQQPLQTQQLQLTTDNNTAVLNHAFASTSPLSSSGNLVYLGYHGGDNVDSSSTTKKSSDTHKSTSHNSPTTKKSTSSSNTKSHSHDNNSSKSSKSNNHSSSNKKNSSSKGHSNHRGGGDSFFVGDPFFR